MRKIDASGNVIEEFQIRPSTVKDVFTGSANVTKNYSQAMDVFALLNTGAATVTVTIGDIVVPVQPGEYFNEPFDDFYTVTIQATDTFRAQVKGKTPPNVQVLPSNPPSTLISHDVEYIGRWFPETVRGESAFSTIYPGSMFKFTVSGTSYVNASFDYSSQAFSQAPYLAVSVDGGPFERKMMADKVELATGLNKGASHTIEVYYDGYYQYDSIWGNTLSATLLNVELAGGGTCTPTDSSAKKNVLFIGDSITDGIRSLSASDNASAASAVNAYPYHTAKKIGANAFVAGFGGTGATKGGASGSPTVKDFVKYDALGVLADDTIHTIVMMVGTNDGAATSASFKTGYQAIIDNLRTMYPDQRIYMVDLFTSANKRATELQELATANAKTTYVSVGSWGTISTTDGLHPDATGAATVGDKLGKFLIDDGWATGGGALNTPPVGTNVWTAAGKPSSYNPLPTGWGNTIGFDGYTGKTFRVSFTASSATGATLHTYTEYKNDFDKVITLTSTATAFTYDFTDTYNGTGNSFFFKDDADAGNIVMSNIKIERIA